MADDSPRLLDIDVKVKIGEDLCFDEPIPRHESRRCYVSVTEKSLMWKRRGSTIVTVQGLTSNRSGGRGLDDYKQHVESPITTVDGIRVSTGRLYS